MQLIQTIIFTFAWIVIIYLISCFLCKGYNKIKVLPAVLYVSSVALIGIIGEISVGSLYQSVFHYPLWQYRILPLHSAHTSYYSIFLWGTYGFYIYAMHGTLSRTHKVTENAEALILSMEAILFELLVNGSYYLLFHKYIFYYLPVGLWHLSAFQAIPFYFFAGLAISEAIKRFKRDPAFYISMNSLIVATLVFLA